MDLGEKGSPKGTYSEQLLQMNYAVRVSESLYSKENNAQRELAKNKNNYHLDK